MDVSAAMAAPMPSVHRLVTVANVVGTASRPSVRAIIGLAPWAAARESTRAATAPRPSTTAADGSVHDEGGGSVDDVLARRALVHERRVLVTDERAQHGQQRDDQVPAEPGGLDERVDVDVARRRPRPIASAAPAGMSPTSAWAPASAASTSISAVTQARRDVSSTTGPVAVEEGERVVRRRRRRTHRVPAGGCRSGTTPGRRRAPRAAPLGRRRRSAPGRRRLAGSPSKYSRVTTRSSSPRANTDRTRCGACGVPSTVGTGGGCRRHDRPLAVGSRGAAGERPVPLPRLDDGVGHRRALAVQHPAVDGDVAVDGIAQRRVGEGEVQERADGLGRRLRRHRGPRTASPPDRARRCPSGSPAPRPAS